MALSLRTPVFGTAISGAGIAVSLTGFSVGDLMLVAITAQGSVATACAPAAGWTEVHDAVFGGAVLGASYYRIKDGTDASTATFTLNASAVWAYAAAAAFDAGGPLNLTAATTFAAAGDSGNTGISFPAVPAPGATGYLGVAFACARAQVAGTHQVTTNPTGWTKATERTGTGIGNDAYHTAVFIKENISSAGETPTGGVWSQNNYESNGVAGLNVAAVAASTFVPRIIAVI